MEIQYTPVNLQMIFRDIEQIFSVKAREKNLEFLIDLDESLNYPLMLDETRLRQVLLNLVGNAMKFTKKGYIRLSAKKEHEEKHENKINIIITVEDTGIGIDDEDQKIIFEAFRQQDNHHRSKYGGTGLGLSISKRLTEMMNGEISVISAYGKGSTFQVALRGVELSESKSAISKEEFFDINNTFFEEAKVLIVDDVESNRLLLNEVLRKVNINVLTAENGQEALIIAGEYQPDVILMDIRMPVMDGIEATRRLKENKKTKDIPVFAVTAFSTTIERDELLKKGFEVYISKPIKINWLFTELSKYLRCTTRKESPAHKEHALEEFSVETIDSPALLVSSLEKEIMPLLKSLQGTIIMNNVTVLGKRLQKMGDEHGVPYLGDFGSEFNELSRDFDILKIRVKTRELEVIIKDLLKTLENPNEQ